MDCAARFYHVCQKKTKWAIVFLFASSGGGNDVVSSSAVGPGATASTSGGPSGSAGRGGGTSLDEVASTMMNIQEQFFHAMEKEQAQERERASQQRLLSEQNQAYLGQCLNFNMKKQRFHLILNDIVLGVH